MAWVGRGAILADRGARGVVGVESIVAVGAQAAQRAQLERGEVATMRRVMVSDGCWRDATSLQTKPTQRLDTKLMRSAALPIGGAIPAVNLRTVWHPVSGVLIGIIVVRRRQEFTPFSITPFLLREAPVDGCLGGEHLEFTDPEIDTRLDDIFAEWHDAYSQIPNRESTVCQNQNARLVCRTPRILSFMGPIGQGDTGPPLARA